MYLNSLNDLTFPMAAAFSKGAKIGMIVCTLVSTQLLVSMHYLGLFQASRNPALRRPAELVLTMNPG